MILLQARGLAVLVPQLDLQQYEFGEQVQPLGLGNLPQELVDPRPPPGQPIGLEPPADGVLSMGVGGQRAVFAHGAMSGSIGAHPASNIQASRIVFSRRITVRLARPSRAAISSLV